MQNEKAGLTSRRRKLVLKAERLRTLQVDRLGLVYGGDTMSAECSENSGCPECFTKPEDQ